MRGLYNLGLLLLLLVSLFRKKSRKTLLARLGVGFPKIEKGKRPLVWIHSVSLGETKAILPLVKRIQADPSKPWILLSSGTLTGHEEGKRALPSADYHLFLPFDLFIRRFVARTKPDLVILTETDFWLHFHEAAKEVGARLFLVNGKISKRSLRRFLRFPSFAAPLFHPFDHLCLQGELYKERFHLLPIPPEKLTVTGNIKLDGFKPEEPLPLDHSQEDFIFTLGSTHDPEEKLFLRALKPLWSRFPHLKILLVPRHPERFDTVARLLEKEDLPFNRFSLTPQWGEKRILLLDAMGQLRRAYALSHLAFVGGSLTPHVGGHNILEPAYFGVPVLYGPHMHAQPDLRDLVRSYKAGIEVTEETLEATLVEMMNSPQKRQEMGTSGRKLIEESKGALERTWKILLEKGAFD